jgi:hypothetical protein
VCCGSRFLTCRNGEGQRALDTNRAVRTLLQSYFISGNGLKLRVVFAFHRLFNLQFLKLTATGTSTNRGFLFIQNNSFIYESSHAVGRVVVEANNRVLCVWNTNIHVQQLVYAQTPNIRSEVNSPMARKIIKCRLPDALFTLLTLAHGVSRVVLK